MGVCTTKSSDFHPMIRLVVFGTTNLPRYLGSGPFGQI